MKLVIDEKLKHRLVGISVIASLAAIFLPAMMKKSSQRLENNFSVKVQLPPKPTAPNVSVTDEEQMFKTIKIARVKLPAAPQDVPAKSHKQEDLIASAPRNEEHIIKTVQAEVPTPVVQKPLELALNDAAKNAVKRQVAQATVKPEPVMVAVNSAKKPISSKVIHAKAAVKPAAKKEMYAVQLASFSQLANAQALVTKLQHKGYKANYTRVAGKNRVIYKVYVGHSPNKDNVVKLKTQLASAMRLNGFVVNTGVS